MNKYLTLDIEKGLTYLNKNCRAVYVVLEIDPMGRLLLKASDISGELVCVTIYNESTQTLPQVSKTERL